jgi:hypothetical protein
MDDPVVRREPYRGGGQPVFIDQLRANPFQFGHDAFGNLRAKDGMTLDVGADGPHQVSAAGAVDLEYDPSGNMTALPGGRRLFYDLYSLQTLKACGPFLRDLHYEDYDENGQVRAVRDLGHFLFTRDRGYNPSLSAQSFSVEGQRRPMSGRILSRGCREVWPTAAGRSVRTPAVGGGAGNCCSTLSSGYHEGVSSTMTARIVGSALVLATGCPIAAYRVVCPDRTFRLFIEQTCWGKPTTRAPRGLTLLDEKGPG